MRPFGAGLGRRAIVAASWSLTLLFGLTWSGRGQGKDGLDVDVESRVLTGYELTSKRPAPSQGGDNSDEQGFLLDMARVQVEAKLEKLFEAELSLELSDALEPTPLQELKRPPLLRDAFLQARFSSALRLRAGYFKRPLSRLELQPGWKLPVRRRGLLNELLIEKAQWGDRGLGAMLWGRVKAAKLRWYFAAMNADWHPELERPGIDLLARVTFAPTRWLALGVNGGRKAVELTNRTVRGYAYGGDVRLRLGEAELLLEANYGEQVLEPLSPAAFGALLLATYDIEMSPLAILQPVAFVEVVDAHSDFSQTEAARLVLGVNVIHHDTFRVMPQVAITRPLGNASEFNPFEERREASLILGLGL